MVGKSSGPTVYLLLDMIFSDAKARGTSRAMKAFGLCCSGDVLIAV
jgi:hypothetical protein